MNRASAYWVRITVGLLLVACGQPLAVVGSCRAKEPAGLEREILPGSALYDSLRNGDSAKSMQMMAADSTWIVARGKDGWTPLHYAVRFGTLATVEWLVAHGADVDSVTLKGETPLHFAEDPAI